MPFPARLAHLTRSLGSPFLFMAFAVPFIFATPQSGSSVPTQDASDLRAEINSLKQIVAAQEKRIEELERNAPTSAPAQPALAQAGTQSSVPVADDASSSHLLEVQNQSPTGSTDERVRNLERQIKGLGPLSFSGDIRLRGEPILSGPDDHSLDRTRARVRARLNINGDLGDQFQTGLSLASGDINDPISTNQTLGGFYTRKTFALDQAFLSYQPRQLPALTLVGGKFHYPWVNTELTWDKDINPEGVAQKLDFNFADSSPLKGISFVGFQLPFSEVARSEPNNHSIVQSIAFGGQVQTRWQIGSHLQFSAYSSLYDFHGADAIALALARASAKNPQTPFAGALPLQAGGNVVQNSIYTTTATNIVTVNGVASPTGVSNVANAQFASKFSLFDNIARLDVATGNPRLPVTFIADFVQNMEACANLSHILAAPANTGSVTYKQTLNVLCNSSERRGYWVEGRIGRLLKRGDWQAGYTRIFIDREAVLGNFDYSDIRQGTNVTEHRLDTFYQLENNVQLGATGLIGRPIGLLNSTGKIEPWLVRLQFDAIYIF